MVVFLKKICLQNICFEIHEKSQVTSKYSNIELRLAVLSLVLPERENNGVSLAIPCS